MIITKDRVVSIDYTLTDKERRHIDTSADSGPLIYLHGHENIISSLERALEGKAQGDRVHITIPVAEAYGPWDKRLVIQVPLKDVQDAEDIGPGMQFEAKTADGFRILKVIEIVDDIVTFDGNHPLAGMDLTFDITIADVREASPEEAAHGHIHSPYGCACCDGCEDEDCDGCEDEE
ncbi:MAG: peptidylprolyl isomerase [Treponema sp.]|jgi:FKBP-type peptidyl-prolyl cis-trans isomerase SlyD|nr:peptidylprolyl isomerase [Treponema sp.]